MKFVP